MNRTERLRSAGWTNADSGDLASLIGPNKDYRAAWCSSPSCEKYGGTSRRGRFVHASHTQLYRCPFCDSKDYLFHDSISEPRALKLLSLMGQRRKASAHRGDRVSLGSYQIVGRSYENT